MVTGKGRYFWSRWPQCRHFIKRHHWADVETAQQTVMEDWLLKEKVIAPSPTHFRGGP